MPTSNDSHAGRSYKCRLHVERLESRQLMAAMADLVAYRPISDTLDYSQYAVPESVETDPARGPGIRINGDDDNRNGKADRLDKSPLRTIDNDLIRVDVKSNTTTNVLTWTGALAVWTTAKKTAQIVSGQLVSAGQQLWVEYVGLDHTAGANTTMSLRSSDSTTSATDDLVFHTFKSSVIVIGGAFQDPSARTKDGVFTMGIGLYQDGYDVQMYRDIAVNASGRGIAYDDAVSAVRDRGVSQLAMVGFSYGGGAVRDLSSALAAASAIRNKYTLQYSGYIDAIRHYSLGKSETRLPTNTAYHDNIFQRNDWLLKGDTVTGANNLNTSTTGPQRNLKHTTIDDSAFVLDTISTNLKVRLASR